MGSQADRSVLVTQSYLTCFTMYPNVGSHAGTSVLIQPVYTGTAIEAWIAGTLVHARLTPGSRVAKGAGAAIAGHRVRTDASIQTAAHGASD